MSKDEDFESRGENSDRTDHSADDLEVTYGTWHGERQSESCFEGFEAAKRMTEDLVRGEWDWAEVRKADTQRVVHVERRNG